MRELAVIMPVYNEEGAISDVLRKWTHTLDALGIDYLIHAYNDGSKDKTSEILRQAASEHDRVIAHDKANSGHGPTILAGYRQNCGEAEWLFQIDSDDEMGPESFAELWNRRNDYDFLLGRRDGRKQPLPRRVISFVSRLCVRTLYGKSVWDVNSPYRLMRSGAFREIYDMIPADTFAPNVIVTGMAAREHLRCFETPVPQRDRQTGEVSIKKWKLAKAAMKSFGQTCLFALKIRHFLLGLALLALLILGAVNSSPLAQNGDGIDQGVYMAAADAQLHGKTLYVDIFDHKGPVFHCLNYGGFRLTHDAWGLWLIETFFFSWGVIYLFRVAQKWFSPLPLLLWLACLIVYKVQTYRPDTFALTLNLWSFALLFRLQEHRRLIPFGIGCMGALIFFSKQTCLLFNGGIGLFLIYLALKEKRVGSFLFYLAGWIVISALVILLLFDFGLASAYGRDCFVFNCSYAKQIPHSMFMTQFAKGVIRYAFPSLLGGIGWWLLYRSNRVSRGLFLFGGLTGLILMLTEIAVNSRGPSFLYQFSGLVFLYWLPMIGLFDNFVTRFANLKGILKKGGFVAIYLLLVSSLFAFQKENAHPETASPAPPKIGLARWSNKLVHELFSLDKYDHWNYIGESLRSPQHGFRKPVHREILDIIRRYPDSPLYVWGSHADLYVETGRVSPIPFYYAGPLLTPEFLTREEKDRFISVLEESYPLIIIDILCSDESLRIDPLTNQSRPNDHRQRDRYFPERLRDFVREKFQVIEVPDSGGIARVYIPTLWKEGSSTDGSDVNDLSSPSLP